MQYLNTTQFMHLILRKKRESVHFDIFQTPAAEQRGKKET